MEVFQSDITTKIPLFIPQNQGNFPGASGLTGLTATLQKNGGPPVPAKGSIVPGSGGIYWLSPDPGDRDVLGPVAVTLNGVPGGDISIPVGYTVAPDPPAPATAQTINFYGSGLSPTDSANLATAMTSLASIDATLQKIATAERAK